MKAGNELTVNTAREIAMNDGVAWCNLTDYRDESYCFNGPVKFEPMESGSGYYITPAQTDEDTDRAVEEIQNIMGMPVLVAITDIDFDDFDTDPNETVYIEWDEGNLSLCEVVE